MRSKLALISLVALAGCGGADAMAANDPGNAAAAATPPASGSVPPEIATAISDWSGCRTARIRDLVDTPRSDEAVVDDALRACVAHERNTISLWERYFGPGSGIQVQDLRARWREALIANVRQVRAGEPPTSDNPEGAWGICVGRNLPDPVPGTVAPEALVDSAFDVCAAEMRTLQADYTRRYGDAAAATHIEQLRSLIRTRALQLLEERRTAR